MGALRSTDEGSPAVVTMAPLGGSDECFSLGSPRSIEACRRRGLEDSDLEERSEESFFRHEQPQQRRRDPWKSRSPAAAREWPTEGYAKADAVIRRERHEINRHRLLREVKKERSALVQGEKHKTGNTPGSELTAPQRLRRFRPATTAPLSPYSRSRSAARSPFPKCEDSSSLVSTTVASATVGSDHRHHGGDSASRSRTTPRLSRGEAGNPVLEGEAQRLEALKRRRFMELQQMLAFQLRSLAREERDRLLAEKARAREATAEAKRSKMLEAADRARIARERSGQEREKKVERQAAIKRARQDEATRRLEAQDHLRRRQAEVAAEKRAELAAQKAALLQARIDRGVRVRRARQLRSERLAAQKADEREAAAEAARRARESENEAKRAAAAERWATMRAAAEEVRRRRDEEADAMKMTAGGKMAELEGRVASFRNRQKEIAVRERELREEETAELARERQEAARRKVARDAERKAEEAEAKFLREKQVALALEIRKEQESAKRRAERLRKEELRKGMVERRGKAEEERRETTRRKLKEDAAKIELLRSEKERLKATRGQLSSETAKQRKTLQGHFEALKDQSHGCNISYGKIAAAVSAAATERGDSGTATAATCRPATATATPRLDSPRTRRAAKLAMRNIRASPSSQSSHDSSRERDTGVGDRTASRPQAESSCYLSGASTTSSLSLPRGGIGGNEDGGSGGGGRRSPSRTETTPRNLRKATSAGGVADLRKRYMYDNRSGSAVGTRATKQATTTPRNRKKKRRENSTSAGGGGDGEGGTPTATIGGNEGTRSTVTPTKNGQEVVTASCDADDGYDEDKALTAAMALVSSSTTVANTPAPPPTPPMMSDAELLHSRYDRELLAILEEEQAAESAREKALAAAKARAKAAQARAAYSGTTTTTATTSTKRGRRGHKHVSSTASGRESAVTGHGGVVGGGDDLQQRREEEAAIATREEAQLKRELARERREASERVMRVSEEYEKALEKISSSKTSL